MAVVTPRPFRPGIVICSRLESERLPGKAVKNLAGRPIISRLVGQLVPLEVPVVVAVPTNQRTAYQKALGKMPNVEVIASAHDKDPLARTTEVADLCGFTHVVRITHDKIFVDLQVLRNALIIAQHETEGIEYIHSSFLTPGTGFEIITTELLKRTAALHKNVEHISYAVRPLSKLSVDLQTKTEDFNLLIDFPEDLKMMEVLFAALGQAPTLEQVSHYLKRNPELIRINHPPILTVYTCVHNGARFIERAMNSVAHQGDFKRSMEYIIVDDHSSDRTTEIVAKFAVGRSNVSWYRNSENLGLSSSSNLALARARGRYIMRLDADDWFVDDTALHQIIHHARETRSEIVYPDNYFGSLDTIQRGHEFHHVGGALFDKKALGYLQFKDGLRNHDSLDIFTRAKNKLKIGYFEKPIFFYTQRDDSMSKTNLEERARTREKIAAGCL